MKEIVEAAAEYRAAMAELRGKGSNLSSSRRCRLAQQQLSGMLWRYRDDIDAMIRKTLEASDE